MGCAGSREEGKEAGSEKKGQHPDDEATRVREAPDATRSPMTFVSMKRNAENGKGARGEAARLPPALTRLCCAHAGADRDDSEGNRFIDDSQL